MKIVCTLCDKETEMDSNSLLAKRLVNHPLKTYLCPSCTTRITEKTNRRMDKQAHSAKRDINSPHP